MSNVSQSQGNWDLNSLGSVSQLKTLGFVMVIILFIKAPRTFLVAIIFVNIYLFD